MPKISRKLVIKRTNQKKFRSKEHKFAIYPPIAINIEINLRIIILINVKNKKKI